MLRIFAIAVFLFFQPEQKVTERLGWEEKSLKWSDFKDKPDKRSPFAASSKTGISHNYVLDSQGYLIKGESVVRAYFYPTLSWYKPEATDDFTLAHEQNHFDISELHARILKQEIANYRFTRNSETEIKRLYNAVEQRRRKMQTDYDRETRHSQNKVAEKEWQQKVKKLLQQYK